MITTQTTQSQPGNGALTSRQVQFIHLASYAAQGELSLLATAQHGALDAGLTVNEIKEAMIHIYAYAGFPRSIRGLQTLMAVTADRQAKGRSDQEGRTATPIDQSGSKYERGRKILSGLARSPQASTPAGYGVFAPAIDTFLKEHLFADIFERDVLTHAERELLTISVLSTLGALEPMLRSHLGLCLNVGITPVQLEDFAARIAPLVGPEKAASTRQLVLEALGKKETGQVEQHPVPKPSLFPTGQKITNNNFTGVAYVQQLISADTSNATAVGNVSFAPGARSNWHYHPAGQILLVIDGEGYYQEKGSPKKILRKGDVVKCPSNIPHWHGASATKPFVQVAITNNQRGATVWLDPVSETEYHSIPSN